jgi:hypothetical protein
MFVFVSVREARDLNPALPVKGVHCIKPASMN